MQFDRCAKIANIKIKPQTPKASVVSPRKTHVQTDNNNSDAWGCTRAKQSRRMGNKTKFLLLIMTWFGQFIGIKAAIIPFFIVF